MAIDMHLIENRKHGAELVRSKSKGRTLIRADVVAQCVRPGVHMALATHACP